MLAGACPLDPDGCLVTSRSSVVDAIAEQARACIDNLEVALTAAGATLDDLVSTRVLVASADSDILALAWRAVRLALNSAVPPSTLLGVTALGYPGQLVEVEAVAAIPATAPAPPLGDLSRSV